MNRTLRRPPRIQPPLRGRSAACSSSGQVTHCAPPVVRPRPPISGGLPCSRPHQTDYEDTPPNLKKLFSWLRKFYNEWPWFFKFLCQLFR
ncbi:MAG: hypothetical protein AAGA75_06620 [Cyanobacteria bacterium P01_E01_bin.6]